ncbi:MAG TPA: AAA family ATPase [Blastocatellia bacterium]|nr:AAA family ATPase [Blastocatellia bacterium]
MKESDLEDQRLLRSIKPANLLSFGPETPALSLQTLNIFIGPNGSGKSNLIEALALMRATPVAPQATSNGDVRGVIRRGGSAQEWIWQGAKNQPATVELVINNPKGKQPLRHLFGFLADAQGFRLYDERVEDEAPVGDAAEPHFYYQFQRGRLVVNTRREKRKLHGEMNRELSILAQLREPQLYPEITYLATIYEKWPIYREWTFGRNTIYREPQNADMRNDRLEEDFSNLGLFLSRLRRTPKAKTAITKGLQDLYEGVTDFELIVQGGTVQVFLSEGDFSIPATRLSDGTLHYLCLMAILYDPQPPPLICIEEPELGLHPDILPKLADHLVRASARTQLIVTTHSDILVDAMTEHPEAIVVCEKHDGKTEMRRLKKEELMVWLDKYRLGELWTRGHIGGTRW